MPSERMVIIGAGLCGSHAAETLREQGFDGEIVLVGAEPHLPYDRPPLSKAFLHDPASEDPTYNPESFYQDRRIELRLGSPVAGLQPSQRLVTLGNGDTLHYDKLLLATGSRPRRLGVAGADLPGVFYLRTLDDARRLREAIGHARRAVIAGGGFIGCEVAAACRTRGLEVTVLHSSPAPLQRVLGDEMGRWVADLHRRHGVDLRPGEAVTAFRGKNRVEQVVTASGALLDADLVVVGIGVEPMTDYLAGSGIAADNGVVVDEMCRTAAPGVFAAGDCACWPHRPSGRRLRVEHWDHAWNQAEAAARAMVGKGAPYEPTLYFWSDQYDVEIQYLGYAAGWDRLILRGGVRDDSVAAFYLDGGVLRAAMCVGRPEAEMDAIRELVTAQGRPAPEALMDEGFDLADIPGQG